MAFKRLKWDNAYEICNTDKVPASVSTLNDSSSSSTSISNSSNRSSNSIIVAHDIANKNLNYNYITELNVYKMLKPYIFIEGIFFSEFK